MVFTVFNHKHPFLLLYITALPGSWSVHNCSVLIGYVSSLSGANSIMQHDIQQ